MDLKLSGKVVLVTGGSKGIGLACARLFVAEGATVAIVSRSQGNLDRARSEIAALHTFAADLTDADAAAATIAAVERDVGAIDVLVNSAGAARRTPADELTPALWHAALDAKFFSYVHAIDPTIKAMAARGRGVIVNVIGAGGKVAAPTHIPGGAANAALMLATAGLATAYAGRGVRVVGVNPGLTATERVAQGIQAEARAAGIDEAEALRRAQARLPLGRIATADEIARIVVFAASDAASYLTGANIALDGAVYPTVV